MNQRQRSGVRFLMDIAVLAVLINCVSFVDSAGQRMEPLPDELEGVGIVEHLGDPIPLDLQFQDDQGRTIHLGDYFSGERPVLFALVYYSCPMLCTLVLNGMVDALREVSLVPGKDFEIVTVSFDPTDTPALAKLKKQNYIESLGRPEAAQGWHFLVGRSEEINTLCESIGFSYRWSEESKQFIHQAAIYVVTPDGMLSRYLYGVMFDPKTVRLSLLEAGGGGIGSPLDQIVLYCFHYNPAAGTYSLAATNLVRAGGLLTVILLGSLIGTLWFRSRRARIGTMRSR